MRVSYSLRKGPQLLSFNVSLHYYVEMLRYNTLKAIFVKEGQKVSAGQLLIQLDDATIKNNIDELNTQLNLAKTTFERQERLWNQKIGSEMQYLQAKAQKESLENNLASIKTQARKMKIIAPFSGIVDVIFPKNGELTNPQMPVVRLINL